MKSKSLIERISNLESRLDKIDNNYKITIIKQFKLPKDHFFKDFDECELRKYFSVQIVFNLASNGNQNVYGCICDVMDSRYLILSDTKDKLNKDVIEFCDSA